MYIYIFIYQTLETSGLPLLYRVSTILPSTVQNQRETLLEAQQSFPSQTPSTFQCEIILKGDLCTKCCHLKLQYMLTATINTALSLKFQRQKKLGLLSVLKYSVTYLQVFGVWYQGLVVYLKLKCPVPSLTQSAERSMCFPRYKVCIESKGSIGQGWNQENECFSCTQTPRLTWSDRR